MEGQKKEGQVSLVLDYSLSCWNVCLYCHYVRPSHRRSRYDPQFQRLKWLCLYSRWIPFVFVAKLVEILINWRKNYISDITAVGGSSSCPSGYELWHDRQWPGIKQGCNCIGNSYMYTQLMFQITMEIFEKWL